MNFLVQNVSWFEDWSVGSRQPPLSSLPLKCITLSWQQSSPLCFHRKALHMRRLYIANFLLQRDSSGVLVETNGLWMSLVSCFFGYHRVRGMICWSADEVYRSTSFILGVLWFFAPLPLRLENTCRWTCRWERSPIRRADKEAEWSCQKPFIIVRRRPSLCGAVTARPYLYSAVTAPSIIERRRSLM